LRRSVRKERVQVQDSRAVLDFFGRVAKRAPVREPPHYCRGNDVTSPREAGKGPQNYHICGSGRSLRRGPRARLGVALMAGNA
jgi:hypothetical protein